ncbi:MULTISPECIES: ABC transporter permease [Pseudothermotoga]|uniref:ABC transporter permease n=1 Tax=Pseudothermotoga TaxID=1643951 RepID=UPI00041310EB|nr:MULTISPECIES: ABC transporter permease subunit [Pseudothermotoga]MBC7122759.1 ABC transporter permease subunit [Pseudothermotoga sp.]MDI6862274.1 ABC transporter permease subunit [Pseudothermotoga sp.]
MIHKELADMKLRSIVIFFLGAGLFFFVAPFHRLTLEMLNEYTQLENMPKLLERFVPKNFVERLSDWSFYIYTQWFGKNLGQFVPILAIIIAFPLFARETENGTMEFLLARSSRKKVFWSKSCIAIAVLTVEMLVFSLLPGIYSLLASKDLKYELLGAYTIHTLVGALFWFTLTMLFSVMYDDQVKPILTAVGILASSTVIGIFKPLRFMNTYSYILGSKIISTGKMDVIYTVSLLTVIAVILLSSYAIFLKKEF